MARNPGDGHLRQERYLEYLLELPGGALRKGAVGIFLLAIFSVLLYHVPAPLEDGELREQ